MVGTLYPTKKSLVVVSGGGWWQTKFSVKPRSRVEAELGLEQKWARSRTRVGAELG